MDLTSIEARVKQLEDAVVNSIANHNALLGRLNEAKEILGHLAEAGNAIIGVGETIAEVVNEVEHPSA